MYHSVIFEAVRDTNFDSDYEILDGDKVVLTNLIKSVNTYDDWHIVPESRPLFLPPDMKTNYVDVPGTDGHADFSDVLVGEVLYKTRTGSMEFIVLNDYQPWDILYSKIMNFLHGQKLRAYLEDDASYFYDGRFTVNKWRSEKQNSRIVIDYDVTPYKRDKYSTLQRWLWDPFDFEGGVVRELDQITVNGKTTVTIDGSRKSVIPRFVVSVTQGDHIDLTWSGLPGKVFPLRTTDVPSPTVDDYFYRYFNAMAKQPDIKIKDTTTTMTFTGYGTVGIFYRGGSL